MSLSSEFRCRKSQRALHMAEINRTDCIVSPALSRGSYCKVTKTIAKAVQNVSAVIKNMTGTDVRAMMSIQFVGTYEGVEGGNCMVSITAAVISAIESSCGSDCRNDRFSSVRGDVTCWRCHLQDRGSSPAGMKKVITQSQRGRCSC